MNNTSKRSTSKRECIFTVVNQDNNEDEEEEEKDLSPYVQGVSL